jgi:hypothetical protein
MQARTIWPFTSISQAPQLPPRQPVGMANPASWAATSQSLPGRTVVLRPWGQWTVIGVAGMGLGHKERTKIDMLFKGIGEAIE